ncbi:enoyl-CoA hydratase [Nocardioides marmoriginsengisoli]|uniref:enoyl-CoA hydratase n=1 Tax=Nocardioides marmoriginsengisoli TaxID=661483 RepID=A0A3N0CB70_9ACTN|nr:crotonase/enoyl-CoA hydratase family protein [Nocardioides marmoriginsengisoli]RNL60692.1 enoyl-CoA hydratase [Nocardioides marmoriginsengisoli]
MTAVLTERDGHVLIVTLNRPEARNAVNADLTLGLGTALEQADQDIDIRAVVLTGSGDQTFCAGADLKAISRGESLNPPGTETWGFAGMVQHPIAKPVIAAVNGTALGGGTELVLASDLAVAADTATFGLPEVRRGLIAAAGGVLRLPEQLPRKVAMRMILTGEPIDAATALRWGLVNEVVPADQVRDAAVALAQVIAANAPVSVQASKQVALGLVDGTIPSEADAWAASDAAMMRVFTSEDAMEGPIAFAEKRAPVWKGR